jgi:hypothetical protein
VLRSELLEEQIGVEPVFVDMLVKDEDAALVSLPHPAGLLVLVPELLGERLDSPNLLLNECAVLLQQHPAVLQLLFQPGCLMHGLQPYSFGDPAALETGPTQFPVFPHQFLSLQPGLSQQLLGVAEFDFGCIEFLS